jgi:NAD(P)-dependent dehydrogenase (short-subunit alcohol dehydrogenase family)
MEQDQASILITGAASGIGAATARRLARPGAHFILHTGSDREGLARTAAAVRERGAEAEEFLGDLRADATIAALLAGANEAGRLDALISNAGHADRTPFEALSLEAVRKAHEVMTLAFFQLAQGTLPLIKASGRGRIVAVSSFVAHRYRLTGEVFAASAAAKAGLEALAKSLALEVADSGVTVNCVVPGHVEKDRQSDAERRARADNMEKLIPMGRLARPDDITGLIEFLLSDDAGYITGQTMHVDGGLTL